MKTKLLTIVSLLVVVLSAQSQTTVIDDIYMKPGDVIKKSTRELEKKPNYKNGAKEIVFIERDQKVEINTPDTTILLGEANDSTELEEEKGYYLNGFNGTESDMEYAARIRKFHNPKYRVFIGDPAYNDIYFLNSFDWNVYVEDNYAWVTPTWTNPYWYDYSFRPYSSWGWNRWGGYNSYYGYNGYGYGGFYNYPWSYNNYWGGYGGYYGGYYGSYWGDYYGYGMGYPYYGYGYGFNHGFYNGYNYGHYYGNGGGATINKAHTEGRGTRQASVMPTMVIGGSSTYRDASAVRNNYTTVGTSNRNIVNTDGARSIRSTIPTNSNSGSVRSTVTPGTYSNRTGVSTGQSSTSYRNASNTGTVNTTRRTNTYSQAEEGTSSGRATYSTGTPQVTRPANSGYTNSTPSRSTYSNSNSSGNYRSSTPSSSSYSSGSSSNYSSSSSSSSYSSSSSSGGGHSSSSSSSGGGGRR